MVLSASKILLLFAVIFAVVAFIAVVFEVRDPKLWPATIALSLAFGWAASLLP